MKRHIIYSLFIFSNSGMADTSKVDLNLLNQTASCDSTCSLDPNKVKTLSGHHQRVSNCGYGYTGTKLEERFINQEGLWEDWVTTSTDNCICTALVEEQEISCPTNQRGQHIQTRNWTCPNISHGNYSIWVTKSNTCDYYYLSTSTEEQTVSCPDNQRGVHVQTRNYENWSDGNARNHTVWSTKSNTCDYYLTTAGLYENIIDSCPAGYTGSINKRRSYDLWSDGSKKNYGNWVETINTCIASINLQFNITSGFKSGGDSIWWIDTEYKQLNFTSLPANVTITGVKHISGMEAQNMLGYSYGRIVQTNIPHLIGITNQQKSITIGFVEHQRIPGYIIGPLNVVVELTLSNGVVQNINLNNFTLEQVGDYWN